MPETRPLSADALARLERRRSRGRVEVTDVTPPKYRKPVAAGLMISLHTLTPAVRGEAAGRALARVEGLEPEVFGVGSAEPPGIDPDAHQRAARRDVQLLRGAAAEILGGASGVGLGRSAEVRK